MPGQDHSIAPKERINVTVKDSIGSEPAVELPLAMMVLGDATGRADDTPLGEREVRGIDKETFDSVLGSFRPSLDLLVEDGLGDEAGGRRAVRLEFGRLADFSPKEIARQVPELRELLTLRDALVTLQGPFASVPQFRKELQELFEDPEKVARLVRELGLDGPDAPAA